MNDRPVDGQSRGETEPQRDSWLRVIGIIAKRPRGDFAQTDEGDPIAFSVKHPSPPFGRRRNSDSARDPTLELKDDNASHCPGGGMPRVRRRLSPASSSREAKRPKDLAPQARTPVLSAFPFAFALAPARVN